MSSRILGIDVSGANVERVGGRVIGIDWSRVARWRSNFGDAVEFAIIKCTGADEKHGYYVDGQARANALGAATVGLLRGFYHFAHPVTVPTSDPVTQARHFVDHARDLGFVPGEHFLMLDIEEARQVTRGIAFTSWVLACLAEIEALSRTKPVVYTGGPFFDLESGPLAKEVVEKLTTYPLCLAAYVKETDVDRFVPKPWKPWGWNIWQRSGDQAASDCHILRVDGIATNVDRDEYTGTVDDLRAWVAALVVKPSTLPSPPPPPPDSVSDLLVPAIDAPAHPLGQADRAELDAEEIAKATDSDPQITPTKPETPSSKAPPPKG